MKQAISIARPQLISLGTCFGRFSKSGKFKLAVTSLDWLGKYAKFKVSLIIWLLVSFLALFRLDLRSDLPTGLRV